MLATILLLAFPVAMAFAAANDLFTMTIPNRISLGLIAAFAVCAIVVQLPLHQVAWHIGIGAAALLVGFALFSFNLLGGGDAKLMAAGALWMGADLALPFIAYTTIFGGLLSVAVLFYRHFVPAQSWSLPSWAMRLHANGTGIPYGIAIAAAGLMLYPSTPFFLALSH